MISMNQAIISKETKQYTEQELIHMSANQKKRTKRARRNGNRPRRTYTRGSSRGRGKRFNFFEERSLEAI